MTDAIDYLALAGMLRALSARITAPIAPRLLLDDAQPWEQTLCVLIGSCESAVLPTFAGLADVQWIAEFAAGREDS